MPQQSKTKKTNNKKKLSKAPFVYIVILLIAVVITVCLVVKNTQSKDEKGETGSAKSSSETNETDNGEETPLPEYTLIDMNNTENAKVEGGTKENTSSKLLEPKTYKGLTVTDIKLVAEGGMSRLTATVRNDSSQNFEGEGIVVVFTNKDGSEYARLNGILPSVLPGDTNEINAATTSDIANAYDFTIQSQQ